MAIEMDSKKAETTWVGFLFYIFIVLAIISIISSAVLFLLCENSKAAVVELQAEIDSKNTKEIQELEQKVKLTKKRVDDFGDIIEKHRINSQFFKELEETTHPLFFFSDIELGIDAGKVSLSGITNDFESLGQQILILEEKEFIKNVQLVSADIAEGGRIGFTIDVSFDPNYFKF